MDWMEVYYIKVHQPRKRKHTFCSLYRDGKTAVHTTIGGKGRVSRLVGR